MLLENSALETFLSGYSLVHSQHLINCNPCYPTTHIDCSLLCFCTQVSLSFCICPFFSTVSLLAFQHSALEGRAASMRQQYETRVAELERRLEEQHPQERPEQTDTAEEVGETRPPLTSAMLDLYTVQICASRDQKSFCSSPIMRLQGAS